MLVIASALSVPDPRERPLEKQQAADQAHLRFRDERSDFLILLALWQFFADAAGGEAVAPEAGRAMPRAFRFVSAAARVARPAPAAREQVAELGWKWTDALPDDDRRRRATRRSIARCSRDSCRTSDARRRRRRALPGHARTQASSCIPARASRRRAPKWVLAAELTETTRLYARCAARIEPEWIERSRRDRCSSATTSIRTGMRQRGEVVAAERVAAVWADAGAAAAGFLRRDRSGGRARRIPARSAGHRRARDQGRRSSRTTGS